jgi:hypothetical protein
MKLFNGLALLGVAVCMVLLTPPLILWGMNTISEQATMGWYIPHGLWTYLAVYAVIAPITITVRRNRSK